MDSQHFLFQTWLLLSPPFGAVRNGLAYIDRRGNRLETAGRLFTSLREFHDWGVEDLEAYLWFMREVEWDWRDGKPALEDL